MDAKYRPFKQLIKQFKTLPETLFFVPRFNARTLVFATYKPEPGGTIIDSYIIKQTKTIFPFHCSQ